MNLIYQLVPVGPYTLIVSHIDEIYQYINTIDLIDIRKTQTFAPPKRTGEKGNELFYSTPITTNYQRTADVLISGSPHFLKSNVVSTAK
jgi:hypothetical protein